MFEGLSKTVPKCHRAQLSMCLGSRTVNFSWKPRDFKRISECTEPIFNFGNKSDHTYASKKFITQDSEYDYLDDIDYTSIFDSEGNWQEKHKRRIINVMDSYRISHEAYHELRHAGKGHFPPLHHIQKEKNAMSGELTYTKHPTVSNFLGLNYCSQKSMSVFCSLKYLIQDDAVRHSVTSILEYLRPPAISSVC